MAIDINIPSQVKNYANLAGFPATGSLKTIFIAEDTNKTYRWTGSAYVEISASQAASWGTITGTLSNQTDLQNALNAKQDSLGFTPVPTSRTLTINGTTQDLSADRTFTISTGITIGTTAITSGTVGRVLFEGTGNVVSESANFFWDNTNGRLGINNASPQQSLDISGAMRIVTTGNYPISLSRASTSGVAQQVSNSGTTTYFGTDSTGGGFLFTGGLQYASFFGNGGNFPTQFGTNSAIRMTIFNTGNVLINTTTDAGYKLDVNGTARVTGNLAFTTGAIYITTSPTGGGINSAVNTFFNNGATWIDDTSVRALDITYANGIKIANTTRYPLSLGTSSKAVASAQLEMVSTTQGFLPPRMTTTQKNAIASPAEGLQVWDTTLKLMSVYNGTTWITL